MQTPAAWQDHRPVFNFHPSANRSPTDPTSLSAQRDTHLFLSLHKTPSSGWNGNQWTGPACMQGLRRDKKKFNRQELSKWDGAVGNKSHTLKGKKKRDFCCCCCCWHIYVQTSDPDKPIHFLKIQFALTRGNLSSDSCVFTGKTFLFLVLFFLSWFLKSFREASFFFVFFYKVTCLVCLNKTFY